ncbi:murein biosynthesis integral membrane protein MurJ [Syntrophomonas erecta subsp. sporosyntropha]
MDNTKNNVKVKDLLINTTIISAGTTTSKILGFIREVAIAAFFGASYYVDAYLVALIIPQMLFSVVGGSLTTTVIPLITEYKEKEGRKSVLSLVNSVTTFMAVLIAIIILLGELFGDILVNLVAPGFSGPAHSLAVDLSRIMFPMMLFMGLMGMGTGILQSQRRFFYPAFIGIPNNLIIIASIFILGGAWGIKGLAVGTLVGAISQWLFQVPDLRRAGFRYQPEINFSHSGFRKMGLLILPVIVGSGAGQINLLVDRMLASGLVEGSIAALNYATKLNGMVYGIIAVAVASAIYPELAQSAVVKDSKTFLSSLIRSLNGLLLIIMPITVGIIILKDPVVRIVFQRGAFDEAAATLTAFALLFYALGLPAMCLREIVFRAFYSLQDTKTPMFIGLGTVALNIILNIILVRYLAHGGLALATSITFCISFLVLMWYLRKKIEHIQGKNLIITGLKIVTAAGVMGVCVYYLYNVLQGFSTISFKWDLINFIICSLVGAVVYFIIIKLLRIEEMEWIINKVCMKLGR